MTLDLLSRVEIGDGVARYEPQRPHDDAHHHHLVCDGCGKLTPFQDDALEKAIHGLAARVAFDVSDHDVTLHGCCENCRDADRCSVHSTPQALAHERRVRC